MQALILIPIVALSILGGYYWGLDVAIRCVEKEPEYEGGVPASRQKELEAYGYEKTCRLVTQLTKRCIIERIKGKRK